MKKMNMKWFGWSKPLNKTQQKFNYLKEVPSIKTNLSTIK